MLLTAPGTPSATPREGSVPVLADPDAGLAETLSSLRQRELLGRRRMLRQLGGAALFASPVGAWACSLIPSETGGPYPGDGTNGRNVLTQSGIVRSDIRASFGSAGTVVAPGTPLTVTLQLVNVNANCAPLAGYAVYLWHCNATGQYSMYSAGVTTQNYLRGVQVSDAAGKVTFTTIFPGAYSGRWPHIHFEVYASAAQAVSGANAVRTSQLALPDAACREVYAQSALYPGSLSNLNQTPLTSDNVFGNDGGVLQIASTSGSISAGYSATLEVGIARSTSVAAATDLNQRGLTGTWYNPSMNGQGLSLEFFPDLIATGHGLVFGGWFTYDVAPAGGAGNNRWYTVSGSVISDQSPATLTIYQNVGGNFDALPTTDSVAVGTAMLSYSSSDTGQFTYAFSDGSGRSGSLALSRLTPNITCSTSTTHPANADFEFSGTWSSPSTKGQGLIVELNATAPVVFCTWYTYAPNGQTIGGAASQRWYTAQAAYTPGARTLSLVLYETTGGVFAATTPTTTTAVGTATLTFASCAGATLLYNFTGGTNAGLAGTIALTRVATTPAGCTA
jgi:protocatechuate 3,4-dioxygenase beta subunit